MLPSIGSTLGGTPAGIPPGTPPSAAAAGVAGAVTAGVAAAGAAGAAGAAPPITTAKCEKHGLRYNPAIHSGCVRCRKEAGENITQSIQRPSSSALQANTGTAAVPTANTSAGLIPAFIMTAILVLTVGGGLYALERMALNKLHDLFGESGTTLGGETVFGDPDAETFEEYDDDAFKEYDDSDGLGEEDEKVIGND